MHFYLVAYLNEGDKVLMKWYLNDKKKKRAEGGCGCGGSER